MTAPKCERCGRFTDDPIEVESPRPDFWNGPYVDLLCRTCATPDGQEKNQ